MSALGEPDAYGAEPIHLGTFEPRPMTEDEREVFRTSVKHWAVQVVAHSYILPEVEGLLDTLQASGVLVVRQFGNSDIAAARSQAATHWHDNPRGRRTLLWLDADTWLHPIACLRLLATAERLNAMVTAASPSRSTRNVLPIAMHPTAPITLGADELHVIIAAGMGCVAHPIEMLRVLSCSGTSSEIPRVSKGWIPFFLPMLTDTQPPVYLAEDWAFWERARAAGFQTLLASEHRVLHFGSWPYQWEDTLFPARELRPQITLMPREPAEPEPA